MKHKKLLKLVFLCILFLFSITLVTALNPVSGDLSSDSGLTSGAVVGSGGGVSTTASIRGSVLGSSYNDGTISGNPGAPLAPPTAAAQPTTTVQSTSTAAIVAESQGAISGTNSRERVNRIISPEEEFIEEEEAEGLVEAESKEEVLVGITEREFAEELIKEYLKEINGESLLWSIAALLGIFFLWFVSRKKALRAKKRRQKQAVKKPFHKAKSKKSRKAKNKTAKSTKRGSKKKKKKRVKANS